MRYEDVRALVTEKGFRVLKEKAPKKRRFGGGHGDLNVALEAGEGIVFHVMFNFDKEGLNEVYIVDQSEHRKDRDIEARYQQLRQPLIDKGWQVNELPKIEDIYANLTYEDDSGRVEMRETSLCRACSR